MIRRELLYEVYVRMDDKKQRQRSYIPWINRSSIGNKRKRKWAYQRYMYMENHGKQRKANISVICK
jgi:hypothetical protein